MLVRGGKSRGDRPTHGQRNPTGHYRRKPAAPADLADFDLLAFEIGDGFAEFEGKPGDHLLNPMGTVHGGSVMTLIDSATGRAGYSLVPAGAGFRTIETKVNLSRPITSDTGRVRAEAHVVSQTRQIISTEARLTSRDGRVLAHGTATLMVVSCAK